MDVRLSLMEGLLDYKINSLSNIIELYVREFNLTAPADTHKAFTLPGTFHAGAHGWFVFLKPLPPGDHTVFSITCNTNWRSHITRYYGKFC